MKLKKKNDRITVTKLVKNALNYKSCHIDK